MRVSFWAGGKKKRGGNGLELNCDASQIHSGREFPYEFATKYYFSNL